MDQDRRLGKAIEAANDALQHLSMSSDLNSLDCTHIDRLLGRIVDLPTEGNQRNSRRNLLVIRQWMITEGPGVVLLEVLGQLYWRLGELNSKQFEKFKLALRQQKSYLSIIQDAATVTLVVHRIQHIQRSKTDACQSFLCEISDLTTMKVDSPMAGMDHLRARSNSPFASMSVQSLDSSAPRESGFVSLIKYAPSNSAPYRDIKHILMDFYIHGVCPGRTVALQSNAYVSLLQVAKSCISTRYAILSLAASYLYEYLLSQKEVYHQAELYYSTQALQSLAAQLSNGENYEGALATSMLLMHHTAINQDDSPLCWSIHANIFDFIPASKLDPHSDPIVFLRTQIILSRTAQTHFALQNAHIYSFEGKDWCQSISASDAQKINVNLGASPRLLNIISSITCLSSVSNDKQRASTAQNLEEQLHSLKQWTSEPQGPEHAILLATAESFRLAALIFFHCRIHSYTRFHPTILSLSAALHALLLSLPIKGALYTAIYPVWPTFIAAVTADTDRRERLYQYVVPIREGDKNTLSNVLRRIRGIRVWLAMQDSGVLRREGWWDDMCGGLGKEMLCLG